MSERLSDEARINALTSDLFTKGMLRWWDERWNAQREREAVERIRSSPDVQRGRFLLAVCKSIRWPLSRLNTADPSVRVLSGGRWRHIRMTDSL